MTIPLWNSLQPPSLSCARVADSHDASGHLGFAKIFFIVVRASLSSRALTRGSAAWNPCLVLVRRGDAFLLLFLIHAPLRLHRGLGSLMLFDGAITIHEQSRLLTLRIIQSKTSEIRPEALVLDRQQRGW